MQYFEIVNAFKIIEIFFELGIPRPPFRPQIGPRVSKFCLPWSGPVPDFQIFLCPRPVQDFQIFIGPDPVRRFKFMLILVRTCFGPWIPGVRMSYHYMMYN